MKKNEIKQTVDLTDAITYLPQRTKKNGQEIRFVAGVLKKVRYGRYGIDDTYRLCDGSEVELCLCGIWVKTTIKLSGQKYFAEGLKGLQLTGITARIFINGPQEQRYEIQPNNEISGQ